MATIEADHAEKLAQVRRLEAVSFRAWPAETTYFDGTWAVRLTPSFPAKRLNSINPLDPSDDTDLAARLLAAEGRFSAIGRPLVLRQSPLAPKSLITHLDTKGWMSFSRTLVMTVGLPDLDFSDLVDRIPMQDMPRYVAASLTVHEREVALADGLSRILGSIRPPTAMFIREDDCGTPLAVALAIHEVELAGLLDIAVARQARGQGLGRDVVRSLLRHVRLRGAEKASVQVEADNAAGLSLYRSLGFEEAYDYVYRAPASAAL